MPSNKIILAAAGSRKTTNVVNMAMADPSKKTLVLTFTIENLDTIRSYFIRDYGMVPQHITLQSWYSFLLQDGARPYQGVIYPEVRIENILFAERKLKPYPPKKNPKAYYTAGGNLIYKDHLAEFVHEVNTKGSGVVVERLAGIYNAIYIDEVQDMSGYDWELIEALMKSKIEICCVGDPRQATYSTSNSHKNSQLKGGNCQVVFQSWVKKGICTILEMTDCYRSNQTICDHADQVFPNYAPTISKFFDTSQHDGVYKLKASQVLTYHAQYSPTVLRYRINSNTLNLAGFNIGLSKGKTFDRVMIFPTEPMLKYLIDGNLGHLKDQSKSSLYVAITRARYSVAYVVMDEKTYDKINLPEYQMPESSDKGESSVYRNIIGGND
jgi:DNA helicase II / ATP-dependent DNA helicase PcrA